MVTHFGLVPGSGHAMTASRATDLGLGLSPPRWARIARWALALAGAVLITVLATASANSELLTRYYTALLVINAVIVVGLAGFVVFQITLLLRARRSAVFGAKLTTRMMMFFAVVAVLPGVVVYAVSVQFLSSSIESFFDTRIEKALDAGLQLGKTALNQPLKELTRKAEQMSAAVAANEPSEARVALSASRESTGVSSAALLTTSGALIAVASERRDSAAPPAPSAMELRQLRSLQPVAVVESLGEAGMQLRAFVPVVSTVGAPLRILSVTQAVPTALREQAERVEGGVRDYQELSFQRNALKRLFAFTLTLLLLLALLTALSLAAVFSERLAAPLARLAEGTRAVAAGDFSKQQAARGNDELAVLTHSFNAMTQQLADAREQDGKNRRAIETSNLYLENVLRNLNAGVLVFNDRFVLRVANAAAAVILQSRVDERVGELISDWAKTEPSLSQFADIVARNFSQTSDTDWQREQEIMIGGNARTLILRGSRRVVADVAAHIVVFDDITEVLQAQRDTAWAEVARRLAHEIKNPLTPIQLSAERLEMKLTPRLDEAEALMLKKGTQTIVNQVTAMKNMVNDFAIYARRPRPGSLLAIDFEALLRETLDLYSSYPVALSLHWNTELRWVRGESTRLRQVLHNLLQNAVDACSDRPNAEVKIEVFGRDPNAVQGPDAAGTQELVVRFCDNGAGFDDSVRAKAFEPYVTTKSKGTGLGLAIVKKIIDEHKGRITLDNSSSGGAIVTLILPTLDNEKVSD
ncbi:MAG: HAMP domain-containing protein [Betaproteobacteria bacterium]|nr:MAG: HAMP domain-containing protein [Betaproteobacteria bacterium]